RFPDSQCPPPPGQIPARPPAHRQRRQSEGLRRVSSVPPLEFPFVCPPNIACERSSVRMIPALSSKHRDIVRNRPMASEDLPGHAYHSRKLLRLDFSTVVRPLEKRLSLPTQCKSQGSQFFWI